MSDNRLKITMNSKVVGYLWIDAASDQFSFEYEQKWVENGFAISPHIPLDNSAESGAIRRFVENLIPEGKALQDIAEFAHISKNNIFAIIKAIGYETSGALMFGEPEQNAVPVFRKISTDEIAQRISQIEKKSIAIWDGKERISLAGVQEKLPVIIKDGEIGLGDGTLCSTHIMKFQTKKHANIVVNELFCMKLAKILKLNVADVELHRFKQHPVLMVERFDRIYKGNTVERLHVIDGCQMFDLSASAKYERNFGSSRDVKHIRNGANFSKLFSSSAKCDVPAKAKLEMIKWSMFNLIVGNSDAHGKNFSYFVDATSIKPTPFYDVLCILAHKEVVHELAMSYGDEFDPDKIFAYQIRELAESVEINYKLFSATLTSLTKTILKIFEEDTASGNVLKLLKNDELNNAEISFLQDTREIIKERAKRFLEVASEMHTITY